MMSALPKLSRAYVMSQARPFLRADPGIKSPTEWEKDYDQFGRIDFYDIGSLQFGRMRANPMLIEFKQEAIKPDDRNLIRVLLQLSGRTVVRQRGRETLLSSGDWTLIDGSRPYSILNQERVEQRRMIIPVTELLGRSFDIESLTLQKFSTNDGNSQLLEGFLRTIFDTLSDYGEHVAADLSGTAIHLLRLALIEQSGRAIQLERSELMRERVKTYINRHLHDSRLSVDSLALAMNCSKRYLHKAFAENDETISQYILTQRLEKCFAELSNAQTKTYSIAQIAFEWGFNSLSHFGKVFAKRYGMTPSQRRLLSASANSDDQKINRSH